VTRRAKIVATLRSTSKTEDGLRSLAYAGMNVARLAFSHVTYLGRARRAALLRTAPLV